jgi:tRNA nucleotidyltransferase (CCA-adding enzyme)
MIPHNVTHLCRELQKHGYKGWVVGGCLRDLLRGHPAADWDLATNALPTDVQRFFPRVIPTGIQHGTVTVRLHGHGYELTTLRGEGAYSDGRRPDSVVFVNDIEADLARRDFTVNAMAYDPLERALIDPFGGLVDLDKRLIRAVGRAEERFGEDGLRVLRAARFVATLEFELEAATEVAIAPTLDTFRKVSAERVRDEWMKALKAKHASRAFDVMARTGILAVTCPFLAALPEQALAAYLRAMDHVSRVPVVRLGALLAAFVSAPSELDAWLMRYRFSNQERERIVALVTHHRAGWDALPSDADLRRFATRVGREALSEALDVSVTVAEERFGAEAEAAQNARRFRAQMELAVRRDTPLTSKELAIAGRDLIATLQLSPGPQIGRIIEALFQRVLDDPSLNQRESLLALARQLCVENAS